MRKSDMPSFRPVKIVVAAALLTRLPMPALRKQHYEAQADAAWAFPVAGLLVGGIAALVGWLALVVGAPTPVAAGLILAAQIMTTGAMHEDGLADTADGLWGGWTRDRRLEIMKDSAIGTYGVLALILSVGLRWAALAALISGGLTVVIAAAAFSRGVLPVLMAALPAARPGGLSRQVGAPGRLVAGVALALGMGLAGMLSGWDASYGMMLGGVGVVGIALLARAKIGGQTGDILGAAQQMAETLFLLGILAAAT